MSLIMLGVLKMPYDMFWSTEPIVRVQHDAIRLEAANKIEEQQEQIRQLKARIADLEQAEFCVVAGKYETIGMQHTENIKYSSYRNTLDEALTALESVNDYPFCRIEYKGWGMYANKQVKGE